MSRSLARLRAATASSTRSMGSPTSATSTPRRAWKLCLADAVRLDAMVDPVALAVQRIAERAFDQGVRISGLGGQIARGFYYVGKVHDRPYTRADAEQLAAWRMFVNEAVEPGLLTKEFSIWARRAANEQVYEALLARAVTSGSALPTSCMSDIGCSAGLVRPTRQSLASAWW